MSISRMQKRSASQIDGDVEDVIPRRSTRQRTSTAAAREAAVSVTSVPTKMNAAKREDPSAKTAPKTAEVLVAGGDRSYHQSTATAAPATSKEPSKTLGAKVRQTLAKSRAEMKDTKGVEDSKAAKSITVVEAEADAKTLGARQYWLMKAEPESRIENGVDVRFSIDDLAAKSEPEPWDGIRNFVARNNIRAMKKGDLSFFYHSNCKEPGIVGTMEVVQEHSPDVTAHDAKCPYYDPKSKPSDPKWSVVHVEFRYKFAVPIGLKELRDMGGPGRPLEGMQMLKQSRLSVSRVSPREWEHINRVAEDKANAVE